MDKLPTDAVTKIRRDVIVPNPCQPSTKQGEATARNVVDVCKIGKTEVQAVMIRLERKEYVSNTNEIRVAMIVPRSGDEDHSFICLVIGLLLVIVSLFFLGRGISLATEQRARATRANLLRNVHVGVLELDEELEILAGNDIAEEILGVALNRFGQHTREKNQTRRLSEFFQDHVLILNPAGEITGSPIEALMFDGEKRIEDPKWLPSKAVSLRRLRGRTARFYACTNNTYNDRWYVVAISPIIIGFDIERGPGRHTEFPSILASIQFVSSKRNEELNQMRRTIKEADNGTIDRIVKEVKWLREQRGSI